MVEAKKSKKPQGYDTLRKYIKKNEDLLNRPEGCPMKEVAND